MLETITIFDDDAPPQSTSQHHITNLKEAVRDRNRVHLYVDDKFFCSLDISQIVDFGIKIGETVTDKQLAEFQRASEFSKLYTCTLAYVLSRPHSTKEVHDYLKRKTIDRKVRVKNRQTGTYQVELRPGYDASLIPLVIRRLNDHGYLDDYRFAELWVENRSVKKGVSQKKLRNELAQKGIEPSIIEAVLGNNSRNERAELRKVIARKQHRYDDPRKLIQYLLRQGFDYSDVLAELESSPDGA